MSEKGPRVRDPSQGIAPILTLLPTLGGAWGFPESPPQLRLGTCKLMSPLLAGELPHTRILGRWDLTPAEGYKTGED